MSHITFPKKWYESASSDEKRFITSVNDKIGKRLLFKDGKLIEICGLLDDDCHWIWNCVGESCIVSRDNIVLDECREQLFNRDVTDRDNGVEIYGDDKFFRKSFKYRCRNPNDEMQCIEKMVNVITFVNDNNKENKNKDNYQDLIIEIENKNQKQKHVMLIEYSGVDKKYMCKQLVLYRLELGSFDKWIYQFLFV
jgi:hypothetical protein